MEGLMRKTSKLVGLAGAVLALSLLAGCSSNEPDPAQRAVNAANRADQAASRAEAAAQKSSACGGAGSGSGQPRRAGGQRCEGGGGSRGSDRVEDDGRSIIRCIIHHHHAAAAEAAPAEAGSSTGQRRGAGTGSCNSVISLRLDRNEGGCIGSRPRLSIRSSAGRLLSYNSVLADFELKRRRVGG